jgi:hypothetical protein
MGDVGRDPAIAQSFGDIARELLVVLDYQYSHRQHRAPAEVTTPSHSRGIRGWVTASRSRVRAGFPALVAALMVPFSLP